MPQRIDCANFEALSVLCAAGELQTPARVAVEAHARICPNCAPVLQREMQLAEILAPGGKSAAGPEPSDLLLSSCRSELSKALDAEAEPRGWQEWLRPRNWAAAISLDFHPAWSVATLLLIGAISGLAGFEGVGRVQLQHLGPTVMTVFAAPPPPVAPAAADPGQNRPAESLYARDAGGNVFPATAPLSLEARTARDQARRDTARVQPRGETPPRFWRNAPPPRLPAGVDMTASRGFPSNSRLAELSRRMESLWWGGVRVDPTEQHARLLQAIAPEYPEAARRAGIEGQVTLLLRIGPDGSVEDATLLSGEPILGRAAAEAVEQWRYSPARIGGQPVNVLTSVTFAFQLQ
jgi:TonB family protein